VCPIRPSTLYVEHPKNGACGVFQHNRPDPDLSAWTFKVTRSIDALGDHHNISKYLQADPASSDADAG
jgi:hypothetical protein